jgi:hypothetical protein
LDVHTDSHAGAVATGDGRPASRLLPGASCWHAVGQAPGTAVAPIAAIRAP